MLTIAFDSNDQPVHIDDTQSKVGSSITLLIAVYHSLQNRAWSDAITSPTVKHDIKL